MLVAVVVELAVVTPKVGVTAVDFAFGTPKIGVVWKARPVCWASLAVAATSSAVTGLEVEKPFSLGVALAIGLPKGFAPVLALHPAEVSTLIGGSMSNESSTHDDTGSSVAGPCLATTGWTADGRVPKVAAVGFSKAGAGVAVVKVETLVD
jgi:hypothetical protein